MKRERAAKLGLGLGKMKMERVYRIFILRVRIFNFFKKILYMYMGQVRGGFA